ILSLLDEETRKPGGQDTQLIGKYYQNFVVPTQKYFVKPRFSNTEFTIKHYASDVTYQIDGFVEKNKDSVSPEQLGVLEASSCEFLKEVISTIPATSGTISGKEKQAARAGTVAKKPTLGGIFKKSLISLMETMASTSPHYVRCIKPNLEKMPGFIDSQMVLSQLRACGVVETLKISHKGYPTKYLYSEFTNEFFMLVSSDQRTNDDKLLTERILKENMNDSSVYQMGLTKVFFKAGQLATLDTLRFQKLTERAIALQSVIRSISIRQYYISLKNSILLVQSLARAAQARALFKQMSEERAAITIQNLVRGNLARKILKNTRNAVLLVQSLYRAKQSKKNIQSVHQKKAAIVIQKCWRGFITRKQYRRKYSMVLTIQSGVRRHASRSEYIKLRSEAKSVGKMQEITKGLEAKLVSLSQALAAKEIEVKKMQDRIQILEQRSSNDKLRHVIESAKLKSKMKKDEETLEKLKQEREVDIKKWTFIESTKDEQIRNLKAEIERLKVESSKEVEMLQRNNSYISEELQRRNSIMSEKKGSQSPMLGVPIITQFTASPAGTEDGNAVEDNSNLQSIVASLRKENENLRLQMSKAAVGKWRGAIIQTSKKGTVSRMNSVTPTSSAGSSFLSTPFSNRMMTSSSPSGLANSLVASPTGAPQGQMSRTERIYGNSRIPETDESIDQLKEIEEEVLDSLVINLRIPLPSVQPLLQRKEILFPANLIGNLIIQLMVTGQVMGATLLLEKFIKEIRIYISKSTSEEGYPSAFWLSNIQELSVILQTAAYPGGDPRRRHTYDERINLRIDHQIKELDSLVKDLYQIWVKMRRSVISRIFVAAVIENQSLQEYHCRAGRNIMPSSVEKGNALEDLLSALHHSIKTMRGYHNDEAIILQFASEMMRIFVHGSEVSKFNTM
ncbi:Myosin type-2 heavy chain 1, partial [Nowakowskiella sp. JEL0078]